jgi:hypothetical protein
MSKNSRALAPSDRPAVRLVWLLDASDQHEVDELQRDGWKEVDKQVFGELVRIEMSLKPEPLPVVDDLPVVAGARQRNRVVSGPKGAFIKDHQTRAWTGRSSRRKLFVARPPDDGI